jgi:hypothetical protein
MVRSPRDRFSDYVASNGRTVTEHMARVVDPPEHHATGGSDQQGVLFAT